MKYYYNLTYKESGILIYLPILLPIGAIFIYELKQFIVKEVIDDIIICVCS